MTWPVGIFWLLLAWGLLSRRPVLIYLFFSAAPFGTLAVVPVELVGGVNLLPQAVCASAIILRLMLDRPARLDAVQAMADMRRLGLLSLFLIVSMLVTAFMPRLFAGTVDVVSMAGVAEGPQPLASGTSNLTQIAYLCLSVLTVAAFAAAAADRAMMATLGRAVLVGGATVAATGLAAMAADAGGAGALLEPFRTVTYVLLTEDEALGARRLAGLMPEASAFGALCVLYGAMAALFYPCFDGALRRFAAAIALTLFVMAALSTSSTAFVGLAVGGGLLAANWLRRLLSPASPHPTGGQIEFVVALSLVIAALAMLLFETRLFDYAGDMIDLMLFQKVSSDSYIERMRWNDTAMDGFWATLGLGVGLGSARASNWFVALLSNTGAIGAALMLGFVAQTFLRKPPSGDPLRAEFIWALKGVLLLSLVMGALAGTSADFGVGTGAVYGMLTGLGHRHVGPAGRAGRSEVRPGLPERAA